MKKIAIHLPVWQRVEMTAACYEGIERIRKEFLKEGYELVPYIGVSERVHALLAEEYGYKYKEVTNETLGLKNQALFEWMKEDDWDVMMQLGSDDFLLPGAGKYIAQNIEEHDFACFRNIYMFRADTREGTLFQGYPCGAGRFMKRWIADKVKLMWSNRRVGLDGCSAQHVYDNTRVQYFCMTEPLVADVKSSVNVSAFSRYKYEPTNYWLEDIVPEAHLIPRDAVLKLE
jgi:hypothetical protein